MVAGSVYLSCSVSLVLWAAVHSYCFMHVLIYLQRTMGKEKRHWHFCALRKTPISLYIQKVLVEDPIPSAAMVKQQ